MTDTVMPTDLPIHDGTNPAHRLADDLRRGRIPSYAADDVRAVLTMLAASPQGEGSSADADTPQPDALPGDLREKIAAIIVRKVLQEDYDDLVEGYLDEILMAADKIILLPAYRAVAETYYDNLARAALTTGEATSTEQGEMG